MIKQPDHYEPIKTAYANGALDGMLYIRGQRRAPDADEYIRELKKQPLQALATGD